MRANDAALEYRMRSDGRDSSELAPFDSANDLARLIRTGYSSTLPLQYYLSVYIIPAFHLQYMISLLSCVSN